MHQPRCSITADDATMIKVSNEISADAPLEQMDDPPCWQNLAYVGGFGLFALTRLLNWVWRPAPVVAGDTPIYVPTIEQGRFGLVDFFGNRSRPGVITVLFAVFESPDRIVLAQHVISGVLWALLLILVARSVPLPRAARAISTLLVSAVASIPAVTAWNDVLMSESFSLSWISALSCAGIVAWSRFSQLTPLVVLGLSAWVAAFTALLGPIRPLSLGVTLIIFAGVLIVTVRSALRAKSPASVESPKLLRSLGLSAAGLLLVAVAGVYVLAVDLRANDAWGREFAGLEDFNGRAIQQLTVVSDSSKWAYDAYWHYIRSVGDECLESGFGTGQYWPATAMQCPEGIRDLADTFQRHYVTDYLRSLPQHLDESLRDYRTGWSYLSHPPGHGVDMLPGWARGLLLNPAPDGAWSPVLYPALLLILLTVAVVFVVVDRARRRSGGHPSSGPRPSGLVFPTALFAASLTAVVLTIIVSPGDPRVAVVHATSARIWLVLSFAAVLSYLAKRPEVEGLLARFTPLPEGDDRVD